MTQIIIDYNDNGFNSKLKWSFDVFLAALDCAIEEGDTPSIFLNTREKYFGSENPLLYATSEMLCPPIVRRCLA